MDTHAEALTSLLGMVRMPAALFKGLMLFTHQVVVIAFATVLVSEVRKLAWFVLMTFDLAGGLGGCIKDPCKCHGKCLTGKACADSRVKRDNVCGTQCKHWSRPMYTESNGWSGEIVISDAHRCKTVVNMNWQCDKIRRRIGTWNDAKFAKDKTILY